MAGTGIPGTGTGIELDVKAALAAVHRDVHIMMPIDTS